MSWESFVDRMVEDFMIAFNESNGRLPTDEEIMDYLHEKEADAESLAEELSEEYEPTN